MRQLLLLFLPLLLLAACLSEEDFSTSPTDRLAFSTDTVAFDTIIAGTPTNTYSMTVYNPAEKALRLSSVQLEKGAGSPFRAVVDGTPLNDLGFAADFEIGSGDSLIVYLMAKLPETDSDTPVPAADNLVFTTEGGAVQKVALTAAGQDVIRLAGQTVAADLTLCARRPYQIPDSLVVAEGATLTLAAGTRLYFRAGAKLIVHGRLLVEGTLAAPVEMRGDRLGNMFDGQPYDRIPAQWGGVVLSETSYGNRINYLDLHSSTFGLRVDSGDVSREKLLLENSILHNSSGNGLTLRMANAYVGNTQITNAGGNCVDLRGGDATFIHCTIGRFYVFTGGNGVALAFSNNEGNVLLPLTRADFVNCIVTGYAADDIMGTHSDEEKFPGNPFAYRFVNCLLNTPAYEDPLLTNCIWDSKDNALYREKNFTPLPDLDALTFSFELAPESKAAGTADPAFTALSYPLDRLGRRRNAAAPSMGCYEVQPKADEGGQ